MPQVPLEGIEQLGIVLDVPASSLPPKEGAGGFAWSGGKNVAFRNGTIERIAGWSRVHGTPTVQPFYVCPVISLTGSYFWVYCGTAKVYTFDGTSHINITRASGGDYTGTADARWQHTILNGVPVFNNGIDTPQFWSPQNIAQPLQNLTAWPAGVSAKVMRAFNSILVGGNITKSGTNYPSLLKWSHTAAAGSVPSSWDETDPTKDAGEKPVGSEGNAITDLVPLGKLLLIYRKLSVDYASPVSDYRIFKFDNLWNDFGVPDRGHVAIIPKGRHAAFTGDDVIIHNGQNSESILTQRMRKYLRRTIGNNYLRSFTVANYRNSELILGFPTTGFDYSNQAIVWNWETNQLSVRDLPRVAWMASGDPFGLLDTWDSDSQPWNFDTSTWDRAGLDASTRRMLMAHPPGDTGGPFFYLDEGAETQDNVLYSAFVERTSFGVAFNKERPVDIGSMKVLHGAFLRMTGPIGAKVDVTFGVQKGGSYSQVEWEPVVKFTIGEDFVVRPPNGPISGRLLSIRIGSADSFVWSLDGIDLDVDYGGNY